VTQPFRFAPLPSRRVKPYIRPTPKRRSKNMTSAVGTLTPTGIMQRIDSQIRGTGYKYPTRKYSH
jgi:hypothetical protein